jgi:hypothetical protein
MFSSILQGLVDAGEKRIFIFLKVQSWRGKNKGTCAILSALSAPEYDIRVDLTDGEQSTP